MITYNPKSWIKLIFALHKSDTLRMLWKELLYMGAFTSLIVFLVLRFYPDNTVLEKLTQVYSLIGFVISLLLVFRTNTAYDRWWEGRKQWGALVNDSRNLASKISVLVKDENSRAFFERMIPNFVFTMRDHLRGGADFTNYTLTKDEEIYLKDKVHIPLEISTMMFEEIMRLKRSNELDGHELFVLDRNLNALLDHLGACERIKNTPIPFSYSLFIKKFIFIYVVTLPLAFVTNFGYYSALIATYVFYVLVSMEVLAEEIENPFGLDDNDLPLDSISSNIKRNVSQVLGTHKENQLHDSGKN